MTERYLHIKAVNIPLYRGKLVIIISNDLEGIKKHIPDFDADEPYAHTYYGNWKGVQGYFIVLNFHNSHRGLFHGTITHEAIHATHFIAKGRGIMPDFDNDESIAYLSEWIADEVYWFADSKGFYPTIAK